MTHIVHTLRASFTPLRLPNLRTYLIGQAISLLGTLTVMTTVNGLLQVLAPPKMRGRLLSAYIIVSFGIQPLALRPALRNWIASHPAEEPA